MFQRVFKINDCLLWIEFIQRMRRALHGFLYLFPIVPMYSLIRLFLFLSSYFHEIFLQRRLTVLKLSIKLRHPCFFQVYCNRKPRIRRAVDSDPQYQVQMYFRLIK